MLAPTVADSATGSALGDLLLGSALTLIGGLFGGLLTAWWQARKATDIAVQVQRAERQDQALQELATLARRLRSKTRASLKTDDAVPRHGQARLDRWAQVAALGAEIQDRWREDLEMKIGSAAVTVIVTVLKMRTNDLQRVIEGKYVAVTEDEAKTRMLKAADDLNRVARVALGTYVGPVGSDQVGPGDWPRPLLGDWPPTDSA